MTKAPPALAGKRREYPMGERIGTLIRFYGFIILTSALIAVTSRCIALSPAEWWHLVDVVDEQTIRLRNDKGETYTITLACIGRAKDSRAAITYITRRLRDQKLTFLPLETGQTNWHARPMCVILDMDLPGGRGGSSGYDFPLLNEELLAWGHTPFVDIKTTGDPYGLKARLTKAKADAERRQKERDKRGKRISR